MITNIKWKNHNILGNLELNFVKKDGTPYNTIVIAGENGTGKTTVLETLANFLSGNAITPFEHIKYIVGDKRIKVNYDKDVNMHDAGWHKRQIDDGESVLINSCKSVNYELMIGDKLDIRSYGVSYSKARSGFKTNPVRATTTSQLDNDRGSIDDEEDFTKIKQLIIDISAQDNADLSDLANKNNGVSQTDYELHKMNSKMFRFRSAFNNFFDNIQFDRVDEQNIEEKRILFRKFGKEIPIDSLSTGEKQIVFRGSYLLKNQKMINGGIVLIDEPELSMHPLWQEKVLKYYRDLFTVGGKQTVQMIVATHSEYVIKSALEDKENVLVISLKNNKGKIEYDRVVAPRVLNRITLAETNYYTFNVASIDFHIQLYGYLQNLTSRHAITACDDFIKQYIDQHNNIDKSIHLINSNYGNTIYKTLSTRIRNAIDHPDGVYDPSDAEIGASIKLLIEIIEDCKSSKGMTTNT